MTKIFIDSLFCCCKRWKIVRAIINNNIYDAGTCLLKKAKNKNKGTKNQKYKLFLSIALIKITIAIRDNNAEWWSTKGVPLEGYDKIEKTDCVEKT